jgi:hypothetical protein
LSGILAQDTGAKSSAKANVRLVSGAGAQVYSKQNDYVRAAESYKQFPAANPHHAQQRATTTM